MIAETLPHAGTGLRRWGWLASASGVPALLVTAVLAVAIFALGGTYYDSVLVLAICYAIVTVGMAVQIGYSGQLAFSQSVFFGAAAYAVAILNTRYLWSVPLALLVVLLASGVVSVLLGLAVTRAPGLALALATVLFPIPVTTFVYYSNYLGTYTGIGGVEPLVQGDGPEDTLIKSGIVVALLLGLCIFVCARILKSGIGLELALSGDQRTAGALGILTSRRKLELFVLGSVLAALGGAVFASTQVVVSPDLFSQGTELTLLVMLFVGGRRSLVGAVVGAIGIEYLSGSTTFINTHLLIIEGVLLTAVLLFQPDGIAEIVRRALRPLTRLVGGPGPGPSVAPTLTPVAPASEPPAGPKPAAAPSGAPILEGRGLSRRFGGLVAVNDVGFKVPGRGLYGICGPNGAGKTTLLELISGGLAADSGQVLVEGRDISAWSAAQRAELGVARTFQTVRLLPHRTALDNVAVACLPSHRTFMPQAVIRSELNQARSRAIDAMARVGVAQLASSEAGSLTLEGQRMVELARAIAARPRLLLLDEPASGLSGEQRERLAELLVRMGDEMTIVIVEHDLDMLARIATRVLVMIDGRLRFEGDAGEFRQSSLVRTELMGLVGEEVAVEGT